jgi:hypothetical protein
MIDTLSLGADKKWKGNAWFSIAIPRLVSIEPIYFQNDISVMIAINDMIITA